MFSDLKRILGAITVTEKNEFISVEGIPADVYAKDIQRIWGTSRINTHMFVKTGRSKVVIPKFFVIEFIYALNTILEETRSPFAKHTIRAIIEKLENETWLNTPVSDNTLLDYDQLNKINVKLLPHQMEFLHQYARAVPKFNLKGYLLAAVPGAGKSLSGISLHLTLKTDAMIIVCPKNAVTKVWVDNVERFVTTDTKIWHSAEGVPPRPGMDYYICHYEYLGNFIEHLDLFKGRSVMIDLDECHNFNDPNSQRTKAFIQMCSTLNCQHVIWASGTPLKAMAKEMIGFLRTVDPYFTPMVEERFKAIFGMSVGRAGDILSHRLGLVSFKVGKERFMSDKPIEHRIDVKVPNSDRFTLDFIRQEMVEFIKQRMEHYRINATEYRLTYEAVIKEYELTLLTEAEKRAFEQYRRAVSLIRKATDYRHLIAEMKLSNDFENNVILPRLKGSVKEAFRKAKGVYKYVELVIRGEALGGVLGKRRIECHVAMLDHIDFPKIIDSAEKKTLIFSSFVEVVDRTNAILVKLGYQPMNVYGDTNKNLESIIKQFDNNPKVNPLIATLQSLSTAVPVLSANTIVFLNSPFRVHEKEQAVSRAHRLGQDTQVHVFDAFLDTGKVPNISTRSGDIMEWSKEQVDLIMGKAGTIAVERYADVGLESFYEEYRESQVSLLPKVPTSTW